MELAKVIVTGIGVVLGGTAIFAGTGAFDDNTTRNDDGEIVEPGGVGAFVLRVGDCFNVGSGTLVTSVKGVPCSQPHDREVYASFDIEGFDEYNAEAVETAWREGCLDRWEEALGTTYEDVADLDAYALQPTEQSWSTGDREVICTVGSVDDTPLEGSRLVD